MEQSNVGGTATEEQAIEKGETTTGGPVGTTTNTPPVAGNQADGHGTDTETPNNPE